MFSPGVVRVLFCGAQIDAKVEFCGAQVDAKVEFSPSLSIFSMTVFVPRSLHIRLSREVLLKSQ